MTYDSEQIAREIAVEQGREEFWRTYHPIVRWTIEWLAEHDYLTIVGERSIEPRVGTDIALNQWAQLDGLEDA